MFRDADPPLAVIVDLDQRAMALGQVSSNAIVGTYWLTSSRPRKSSEQITLTRDPSDDGSINLVRLCGVSGERTLAP